MFNKMSQRPTVNSWRFIQLQHFFFTEQFELDFNIDDQTDSINKPANNSIQDQLCFFFFFIKMFFILSSLP